MSPVGRTAAALRRYRHPRQLHPGAWWLWAIGMAVACTSTTNPVLLALMVALVSLVVVVRRPDAPWAMSFGMYLWLGLFILIVRTGFRIVFSGDGPTVLFTIPFPQPPDWIADQGGRLFGPVSAEALLSGLYDGVRLAAMVICVGAANSLANAKRMLAAVPPAFYELGTVIVVAVSVFPQLAESVRRVTRARQLRADGSSRRHWLRQVMMPVFVDALDRSILLAASMDSRGYGRRTVQSVAFRRVTSGLLVLAVLLLCVAAYALFDPASFGGLGRQLLVGALAAAAAAMFLAGRRSQHTRYRPDRWHLAETLVAACGVATAAGFRQLVVSEPETLYPSIFPLEWPVVTVPALLLCLVGALPVLLAPPVAGVSQPQGRVAVADRPAALSLRLTGTP
ncbi:MAG: energy-coupling factor transporter transmembrane component T [Propionicimonas sp.]|uniref:energy-coupling factor transporter transmembrane component T n=1 Tax=Propionicimonas sp. TaxID=1955623 RepID=UPI002B201FBC|nr:energy-coupling factor transporter transmembrane component T [Propionicimonas sp.]MEA4943874.1 energy-coupling factor transporter transmembrane component T [Propionicimonas sp.]MEA5118499.1 energy-coupling factor transporter transmembrane component T [Propionicimonas sp.]